MGNTDMQGSNGAILVLILLEFLVKSKKILIELPHWFSFLRSIANREVSCLVYCYLGNRWFPLSACAYTAIRK